jgi:hypothetical protein
MNGWETEFTCRECRSKQWKVGEKNGCIVAECAECDHGVTFK